MRGIHLFTVVCFLVAVAMTAIIVPRSASPPTEAMCQDSTGVGFVPPLALEPSPIESERVIFEEHVPLIVQDTVLDARCSELEAELVAMKAERDQLLREIEFCRYPEDTPWGAFLRLPDSATITDPKERRWIELTLEDFPVRLVPGEALGLLEEVYRSDTATVLEGCIAYLGADRIQNEIPASKLKELEEWMQDDFATYFVARR